MVQTQRCHKTKNGTEGTRRGYAVESLVLNVTVSVYSCKKFKYFGNSFTSRDKITDGLSSSTYYHSICRYTSSFYNLLHRKINHTRTSFGTTYFILLPETNLQNERSCVGIRSLANHYMLSGVISDTLHYCHTLWKNKAT